MTKPVSHNVEWAIATLVEILEEVAVYEDPEFSGRYRVGLVGQDYATADFIGAPHDSHLTNDGLVRFAEGVECASSNRRFLHPKL